MISIIIPAYNEEENIRACFSSLSRQYYKNFEVILVDDCSSDDTAKIAKQIGIKQKITLHILKQNKRQERTVARNFGAKQAGGEYLLFIDADMRLERDVLSECADLVKMNKNIKGVIISEESVGVGFWADCRKLEKKCYLGDDTIEAARFFNKNSFWKVGGWDKEMVSGEDWDLTRRIRSKHKIGRVNTFIQHNEGKLTLWEISKKKFYYASKSGVYLKKYPLKFSDIVFFVLRPAYLRNWKLLASDPKHAIGMYILKFIEIIAGGLGFLYSRLLDLL